MAAMAARSKAVMALNFPVEDATTDRVILAMKAQSGSGGRAAGGGAFSRFRFRAATVW